MIDWRSRSDRDAGKGRSGRDRDSIISRQREKKSLAWASGLRGRANFENDATERVREVHQGTGGARPETTATTTTTTTATAWKLGAERPGGRRGLSPPTPTHNAVGSWHLAVGSAGTGTSLLTAGCGLLAAGCRLLLLLVPSACRAFLLFVCLCLLSFVF
jgi:hypothetical protein